ncbi:unnamed protein product [Phytophthora lilii]|uniref:Unnamed protein product n=1 Tax=Phytophthora lilii TaxID=2077276 RepID=A0A9W7CRE0_9STRA|nr:unnamed protein product [Phytophthora lilii]
MIYICQQSVDGESCRFRSGVWSNRNFAALHGLDLSSLGIVKYHHCYAPPLKRRKTGSQNPWWPICPSAIKLAVQNGHLEVVKWIHNNRRKECPMAKRSRDTVDKVAANGDLGMIQWLYTNRSDACTVSAMDDAAGNDHLEVVQWLHMDTTTGCTTGAMDQAAATGRLEVLKWLFSNRNEGCTTLVLNMAIMHGHLSVVHWIHEQFPHLVPTDVSSGRSSINFDMVLYLHSHYPQIFTRQFVCRVGYGGSLKPSTAYIMDWLKANFPPERFIYFGSFSVL